MLDILLIDDETDYSETMAFWLMAKGHTVRCASSGEDGVKAIENRCPHIVLLDMLMPGMDGIETLKKIRQEHPSLPVIMVTAYAEEEKKIEAQLLGVSGFFSKGDDFSEAARLIAGAINKIREE